MWLIYPVALHWKKWFLFPSNTNLQRASGLGVGLCVFLYWVFVWFWYQHNSGFIKRIRKHPSGPVLYIMKLYISWNLSTSFRISSFVKYRILKYILMILSISLLSVVISLYSFLILWIWNLSLCPWANLCKDLSVLAIFWKTSLFYWFFAFIIELFLLLVSLLPFYWFQHWIWLFLHGHSFWMLFLLFL